MSNPLDCLLCDVLALHLTAVSMSVAVGGRWSGLQTSSETSHALPVPSSVADATPSPEAHPPPSNSKVRKGLPIRRCQLAQGYESCQACLT